jgi:hypothetical protein
MAQLLEAHEEEEEELSMGFRRGFRSTSAAM